MVRASTPSLTCCQPWTGGCDACWPIGWVYSYDHAPENSQGGSPLRVPCSTRSCWEHLQWGREILVWNEGPTRSLFPTVLFGRPSSDLRVHKDRMGHRRVFCLLVSFNHTLKGGPSVSRTCTGGRGLLDDPPRNKALMSLPWIFGGDLSFICSLRMSHPKLLRELESWDFGCSKVFRMTNGYSFFFWIMVYLIRYSL